MNKFTQLMGLYNREVARFLKVPLQTVGAPIINSLLYLLIFGVSLGHSIQLESNIPYLAFLIPGLIAMSMIKNSFDNATSAIMGQKYVNELQDLRVAPLSYQQLIAAKSLSSLTRGLFVGLITYIVGQVFYVIQMGHFLPVEDPVIFLYFSLFGGLAFGNLGIAIGMWSKSFEHVGAVSMLILLPLIYLGGVFFSLEGLHSFWQSLSHFNPLFFMINGIRYGMLGHTDIHLGVASLVTFGFFLLCYFLAYLSLRNGSNYIR
jgi:ABC-2 type transport system permease protein